MSCMVTTTDSTPPSSERMGVALSSTVTLRPLGASITISSARTVSLALRTSVRGNSIRDTSRPSARRMVISPRRSSSRCSGSRRLSIILLASRLNVTGAPVPTSNTATPTGEVSISVARPALARFSSRCRRALAMTCAACAANISNVFLVFPGELAGQIIGRHEDVAHARALVEYRGCHEGGDPDGRAEVRNAYRPGQVLQVSGPQRS